MAAPLKSPLSRQCPHHDNSLGVRRRQRGRLGVGLRLFPERLVSMTTPHDVTATREVGAALDDVTTAMRADDVTERLAELATHRTVEDEVDAAADEAEQLPDSSQGPVHLGIHTYNNNNNNKTRARNTLNYIRAIIIIIIIHEPVGYGMVYGVIYGARRP